MKSTTFILFSILAILSSAVSCKKEPVGEQSAPQGEPKVEVVEFEDKKTKILCLINWDADDDGELSYEEAAAVTDLGEVFKEATISTFYELRYFTSLTTIPNSAFQNSTLVDITLPEGIISLGNFAFKGCAKLNSITIPFSVESIGAEAFANCPTLGFVECLPYTPPKLGFNCFKNFTEPFKIQVLSQSLEAYKLANRWQDYSPYIIEDYYRPLYFADDKVRILCEQKWDTTGDNQLSFTELDVVTDIGLVLSESDITSFDEFQYFVNVHSLAKMAFLNCTQLKSIKLPADLTIIEDAAFYNCTSLETIKLNQKITRIGKGAFFGCTSLKTLTLPETLKTLEPGAFRNCTGLESLYFTSATPPSGENEMFYNNAEGRKIYVPYKSIGKYMNASHWKTYAKDIVGYDYENGEVVEVIDFAEGFTKEICLANWDADGDGILTSREAAAVSDIGVIFKDSSILWFDELKYFTGLKTIGPEAFYSCASLQYITIPESVTSIDKSAFKYCISLEEYRGKFASEDKCCLVMDGVVEFFAQGSSTSYTLPSGVTAVGDSTFMEATNLEKVVIPSGVKTIGDYAFHWCEALKEVTIPEGVTHIGKNAFSYSAIESVTIPSTVRNIGNDAFGWCTNLSKVYCLATTPPNAEDIMYGTGESIKIYVPGQSVEAYQAHSFWGQYTIVAK